MATKKYKANEGYEFVAWTTPTDDYPYTHEIVKDEDNKLWYQIKGVFVGIKLQPPNLCPLTRINGN